MSTATTTVGKFVWHENVSTDPGRARDFYSQLLGWEYEVFKAGDMEYPMIKVDGHMHGGFPTVQEGTPSHWVGNINVESVDETVAKTEGAGGSVIMGPTDIPDVGRYAVLRDPQGAVICAFQPSGEGPVGTGVFGWDELATQDVAASEQFYGAVFGWTTEDMGPDYGGYKIFQLDTDRIAGVMKSPDASMPSMWIPYILVDDVDETVTRAKELGATAFVEGMDIKDVGRIAVLSDPVGAVFGLFRQNS